MPEIERIVFFGTPELAVPTLDALVRAGKPPVAVVTQPARPAGRGKKLTDPPVAQRARALSLEIGRPLSQSEGEVNIAIEQFDWFAGEAERLFGKTIPSRQGGRLQSVPEPVGIVAAFTAWNFPVNLIARKVAPA